MNDANVNIEDEEGIVFHEHFESSKEELWEVISDQDELSVWLGGRCTLEPKVGGAIRFDLPTDGVTANGTIRRWAPPDPSRSLAGFEHTFVDEAAPDVLSVCGWWLIPADRGCDLRFTQQAVEDSGASEVKLAGPWARLGSAIAASSSERVTTPVERAVELLRAAKQILLVSWVTEDIPRQLVEAGFSVVSKNGPGPDDYGRAEMRDGGLHWTAVDPPTHADLLHLDWTSGFHEYLDLANAMGVRTFWYHSSMTKPPLPADVSGCWVPPHKSARLRATTEPAGIDYIDDHYILDIARRLSMTRAERRTRRAGRL